MCARVDQARRRGRFRIGRSLLDDETNMLERITNAGVQILACVSLPVEDCYLITAEGKPFDRTEPGQPVPRYRLCYDDALDTFRFEHEEA